MNFPVHFSGQLREHLKALRKERGLTQAALGQLLGVGQARIAEIESNPGVVSVDQLMKLLSALHAAMVLQDDGIDDAAKPPADKAPGRDDKPAARPRAGTASGGQRRAKPLPVTDKSSPVAREDAPVPRMAAPVSPRGVLIRAKKGSW